MGQGFEPALGPTEATDRAMGDSWFHAGDAAVRHPDGYIDVRDRIKDVIISGSQSRCSTLSTRPC